MSKFQALVKGLPLYWRAKYWYARRKYRAAIAALGPPSEREASPFECQKTVMIFTSMGIFADHAVVDTLLAHTLVKKGARVIVVFCDAQMAACHVSDRYANAFALTEKARWRVQRRMCGACVSATKELTLHSGLSYAFFSEGVSFVTDKLDSAAIVEQLREIDLSDEINSGAIRFAASSHPSVLSALPSDVRSRYSGAASTAKLAVFGLIQKYRPGVVIGHHGIYVPQGVVQKVSKVLGAVFYSWHVGYRKSTLIFSRDDTYHRELTQPLSRAFEGELAPQQRDKIVEYLQSRVTGGGDWIHFNRRPVEARVSGDARPYFVVYTSVDWDAALHFPASVYSSQFEFLDDLIRIFHRISDLDLVIRVHPAEVTGFHPAARSVTDHLRSVSLLPNIKVVRAADRTSSYDLAKGCVAAIVFNTKLGIELPPFGIPVIVAGDCWIRGKGFSYDVNSKTDLEMFIRNRGGLVVTEEQRQRALQFAYYFYFRRCIEMPELLASRRKKFGIEVNAASLSVPESTSRGLGFVASMLLSGEHVEVP